MLIKLNKAQAVIEYVVLIIFLLAVFLLMQKYVAQGIFGRWKGVGDSLSSETGLYDPDKTLECEYDYAFGTDSWYNTACYEAHNCTTQCYGVSSSVTLCRNCINGCHATMCNDSP